MKINSIKRGLHKAKAFFYSLRFSSLNEETQGCMENEMSYFNNRRMIAILWVIMGIELLNMFNVICFSNSGLSSSNNLKYFIMYVCLFVITGLELMVRRIFVSHNHILQRSYFVFAMLLSMWSAALNRLDSRHGSDIIAFATVVCSICFLMRFKPWEIACVILSGFIIIILVTENLSPGVYINGAIISIIGIGGGLSRYASALEEIGYRQKLVLQNNRHTAKNSELTLLKERHTLFMEQCQEMIFEWNIKKDTLECSKSLQDTFGWRMDKRRFWEGLLEFDGIYRPDRFVLSDCFIDLMSGVRQKSVQIRIKNIEGSLLCCHVKMILQPGFDENPVYAVGWIHILDADRRGQFDGTAI